MSIAIQPDVSVDPRSLYAAPAETWDLNKGGLYSFRVCTADPTTGVTDITVDFVSADYQFSEFVLPVNPQSLQLSIPFAMSVSATSGGILEENNGVVFRQLSISGSFGVAARKAAVGLTNVVTEDLRQVAPQNNFISAGPISTGAALLQSVSPLLSTGISITDLHELGHSKINALLNYFVAYAQLKKQPFGANARLVFIDRKNGVNYACTPQTFDTSKDASDPHVTRFHIQLKVWDLVRSSGLSGLTSQGYVLQPGVDIAAALLAPARAAVFGAADVLQGVVTDFQSMVSNINSLSLMCKSIKSTTLSWGDLNGPTGLVATLGNQLTTSLNALGANIQTLFSNPTNPSGQPISTSTMNPAGGLSSETGAQFGTNQSNFLSAQALDFSNPCRTFNQRLALTPFLDQIQLTAIALTPAYRAIINRAIATVAQTTVAGLDTVRAQFQSALSYYEDSLGLTDATVNATTGRVPGPMLRSPQPEDYLLMGHLNDLVSVVDALTATRTTLTADRVPDPFIRAQSNANNPSVVIADSTTGYPVPFPAGGTLEGLAALYLGDPDRWIEIAIANGLQPPYVDEVGFVVPFSRSGNGNTFLVSSLTGNPTDQAALGARLYVGQEVTISSTLPGSIRLITGITQLSSGSWLVTVNGPSDLANYTIANGAQVKGYAENTVNSLRQIVIPVPGATTSGAVPNTLIIPSTAALTRQQLAMGVDLLLDSNFDIALSGNDFQLATGITNALQAVRLGVSVEKGSLLQHPEYGLGIQVGSTNIAASPTSVRSNIEDSVLADDRFQSIPSMTITFVNDAIFINMVVRLAGGQDTMPLSFSLSQGQAGS